jgi:hypothetical protein
MGWKTFNDRLAVFLILLLPGLWIINRWITLPAEVNGALIATWTLVIQYYFRKKPEEKKP